MLNENEKLCDLIQRNIDRTANLEKLYFQNLTLIREICKNYTAFEEMADLEQVAFFGIAEAAEHYQPDRGAKFSTYFPYWIKRTIRLYLAKSQLVKKSDHINTLTYQYKRFMADYEAEHAGLLPPDEIIMEALNLTESQLEDIKIGLLASNYSSLDKTIETDTGEVDNVIDFIEAPDNTAEAIENAYKGEMQADIARIMKDSLTDEEQELLRAYYWQLLTLEEIGRAKGLTKERIRQKIVQSHRKMNRGNNASALRNYAELENLVTMRYRGSFHKFKEMGSSCVEAEVLRREKIENRIETKLEAMRKWEEESFNRHSALK